ncbi:MAG: DegT/DnrJ/EryC1/StrS family aminotransferase [Puniceicoccales bacterium]
MKVPLLDLNQQNQALAPELRAAFDRVLGHGQFILGNEVAQFEEACAKELNARHAIAVSSGTDALLLALMTLGIGPGDEVICPSFSFFATAGAIARVGAKPIFADICPTTFNLDPQSAESRITQRTKAIMPVHLFGQTADMAALLDLAQKHGLCVIEDAAQAFGAEQNGQAAGTYGDFGCFSFFPSKNLGGFGDGGLVTTNDDDLAERARILRVHGGAPKYYHAMIGGNFRCDALQAALLAPKLPHHRNYREARASHAAFYQEALVGCSTITLPTAKPENLHIWNQFTLRLPAGKSAQELPRDLLKAHLAAHDIGSEIYYPVPLHRQECFAYCESDPCPESDQAAREVLSIPVYPELSSAQREHVAATIRAFATEA